MADELATGFTEAFFEWESAARGFARRLPAVYKELRRRADTRLREKGSGRFQRPTEVVDEALHLVDQDGTSWQSRSEFLAEAARKMDLVLEESGSREQAQNIDLDRQAPEEVPPAVEERGRDSESLAREHTVTELLIEWQNGNKKALERLLPLVYNELRRVAEGYFREAQAGRTLEPTALVNEAYLKLRGRREANWATRRHFFGMAAQLMRRVLVDHAREQRAAIRLGGSEKIENLNPALQVEEMPEVDLIALDKALNDLARIDPNGSRVVELRFFAGLTHEEIAEVLGVARIRVQLGWQTAKLWLYRELAKGQSPKPESLTEESFLSQPALKRGLKVLEQADAMLGRRIGAYEVVREIGRGGMGAVFLAERAADAPGDGAEARVAIKILPKVLGTEELLARFTAEWRILGKLDHPSIARLYESGTDDGLPYFTMEYVEGRPIDVWCDEERLSMRSRLDLFGKVVEAVAYAHRHRVVHRDLKPSNILVTAGGEPKLLDFGIAELLDDAVTAQPDELRPMTLEYASPEQMRGGTIAPENDVYTLGVLLYELLAGERPYRFEKRSLSEALRVLREEVLPPPSGAIGRRKDAADIARSRRVSPAKLRRLLAKELDDVVLKALAQEPSQRYRTVEEFGQRVSRCSV